MCEPLYETQTVTELNQRGRRSPHQSTHTLTYLTEHVSLLDDMCDTLTAEQQDWWIYWNDCVMCVIQSGFEAVGILSVPAVNWSTDRAAGGQGDLVFP